jgi:hypothetical protein
LPEHNSPFRHYIPRNQKEKQDLDEMMDCWDDGIKEKKKAAESAAFNLFRIPYQALSISFMSESFV